MNWQIVFIVSCALQHSLLQHSSVCRLSCKSLTRFSSFFLSFLLCLRARSFLSVCLWGLRLTRSDSSGSSLPQVHAPRCVWERVRGSLSFFFFLSLCSRDLLIENTQCTLQCCCCRRCSSTKGGGGGKWSLIFPCLLSTPSASSFFARLSSHRLTKAITEDPNARVQCNGPGAVRNGWHHDHHHRADPSSAGSGALVAIDGHSNSPPQLSPVVSVCVDLTTTIAADALLSIYSEPRCLGKWLCPLTSDLTHKCARVSVQSVNQQQC